MGELKLFHDSEIDAFFRVLQELRKEFDVVLTITKVELGVKIKKYDMYHDKPLSNSSLLDMIKMEETNITEVESKCTDTQK